MRLEVAAQLGVLRKVDEARTVPRVDEIAPDHAGRAVRDDRRRAAAATAGLPRRALGLACHVDLVAAGGDADADSRAGSLILERREATFEIGEQGELRRTAGRPKARDR